jgi:tetratricopeptide (TPR) repeat protein
MTSAAAAEETLRALQARVDQYSRDRYPVQHATARFHLGVALLQRGRLTDAVEQLAEAVATFRTSGMPVEHAKATMMLGIALREAGRLPEATRALTAAAAAFAEHDQGSEHAAALHNLGMVARDRGELEAAAARFAEAAEAFDAIGERVSRSAADRELGTTYLTLGQAQAAVEPLQRAFADAGERGDGMAWGAAANPLGLAQLALGRLPAAEEAFRAAVSANPRSVRPEGYAMAKANLALVHEEAGSPARARLAARQARAVPEAPEVVVAQAEAVLARLGDVADDLTAVLVEEAEEEWAGVLRDELGRWVDADDRERARAADGWIDGVLNRRDRAAELIHAWLDAVLELPPEAMERVLDATVLAWVEHPDEERRESFRSLTSRALPRFHLPQWQRLQGALERLCAARGEAVAWR